MMTVMVMMMMTVPVDHSMTCSSPFLTWPMTIFDGDGEAARDFGNGNRLWAAAAARASAYLSSSICLFCTFLLRTHTASSSCFWRMWPGGDIHRGALLLQNGVTMMMKLCSVMTWWRRTACAFMVLAHTLRAFPATYRAKLLRSMRHEFSIRVQCQSNHLMCMYIIMRYSIIIYISLSINASMISSINNRDDDSFHSIHSFRWSFIDYSFIFIHISLYIIYKNIYSHHISHHHHLIKIIPSFAHINYKSIPQFLYKIQIWNFLFSKLFSVLASNCFCFLPLPHACHGDSSPGGWCLGGLWWNFSSLPPPSTPTPNSMMMMTFCLTAMSFRHTYMGTFIYLWNFWKGETLHSLISHLYISLLHFSFDTLKMF